MQISKLSRRVKTAALTIALGTLVPLAVPQMVPQVFAHHPPQAKFDDANEMTLSGIVTSVDWQNPHVHIFVNVKNGSQLDNWAVELESPLTLKASGWTKTSLKPGDSIEVKGIRARDGSRQIWSEQMTVAGKEVYTPKELRPALPAQSAATPRGSDGKVVLGTAEGYWGYPSEYALVEDGVNVQMDRYGQLSELSDASKVAPLQPWALGLYQHRQERDLQDDPLFLNCKPPGGPRQYQSDLGIKFVEDKINERIFVLVGSGNRNFRIVYMDGREKVGSVTGDDDNPLYYGRSLGRWEGDTLVVTTTGFNEDFWFTNGGLPHTSNMVLTERFTRPNLDTLQYEVSIDDSGAYTRPWKSSWTMQWIADEELPIHYCQDNRP